ncbi:penicillin-binding protein [Sungkyunkwania multivorans]|uniref:Penicillin-binding protein n=1 Tax=Sungkyunkwania multivorans TaxID=1173618 RepID=A0ABW3D4R3_9FLAO
MAVTEKNILNRLYFVAGCMFIFAIVVVVKLLNIQLVEGDKYRRLAEERTVRNFTIHPNRGNIYADDGSLLATSVPKYDIRFDAVTVSKKNFNKFLEPLSDSLSKKFGKPSSYYQNVFARARANKNRYLLVARNLGYNDYIEVKDFPLFKLGPYKGGLIVEQRTVREHPIGKIAERTVGYDRKDENGYFSRAGLEGAYGEYLRGKEGKRLKQKIAKNQWKPITDSNEIEPEDGFDIISTINVNIQDIAHHALLEQLQKYKADHGCAVVMEVGTGEIKAIANLGRNTYGNYYERRNYAVWESHEPGSTFKLMTMVAALEDRVIDTNYVIDTKNGILKFYGKTVEDSKWGGYGKITASKAFEVSSNTGVVGIIDKFYSKNPSRFVNRLYNMELNNTLDLPIIGEGVPKIPHPNDKKNWSGISLQWMAYGYGVSMTPLQTLTYYNAIANKGEMVRPRFVKAIKDWGLSSPNIEFKKQIINPSICSKETVAKVTKMMQNVIEKEHGTGHDLYSPHFSMAGKTGTAQKNYGGDKSKLNYISSFAGFFPVENPKYSCIVVIHEPDKSVGYYGADVAGPVFKKIAQKIYTDTPIYDEVDGLDIQNPDIEKKYEVYHATAKKYKTIMPNLSGMPLMDAISLLENMRVDVEVEGSGDVVSQSVTPGTKLQENQKVTIKAS